MRKKRTEKRLAVIQSNYIPWKGYFDIINMVDEFILYDDAQYTKNDWRNRNLIKTKSGTMWLTIPVQVKGRFGQRIYEAEIVDSRWTSKHWKSIQSCYARAGYFDATAALLEPLYTKASEAQLLSDINELFIREICKALDIRTKISRSMDYDLRGDRIEILINFCSQVGATEYLTVPNTKSYLDESRFRAAGIDVRWMSYSGYKQYKQLYSPPFVHTVSILDLLFNEGAQGARRYMLSTEEGLAWRDNSSERNGA